MLKGREIEDILRNRGFEQGTRHILRELAEAQMALNVSQIELAQAFSTIADSLNAVAGGYVGIRRKVESLTKSAKFEGEFDDDKSKS